MSAYIPSKGDFFYVQFKPWDRPIGGFLSDTVEVVKQQDRSYMGDVFICVGRDDHALVGTSDRSYTKNLTFVHSDVTYYPVGPEVLQALGLVDATKEREP